MQENGDQLLKGRGTGDVEVRAPQGSGSVRARQLHPGEYGGAAARTHARGQVGHLPGGSEVRLRQLHRGQLQPHDARGRRVHRAARAAGRGPGYVVGLLRNHRW